MWFLTYILGGFWHGGYDFTDVRSYDKITWGKAVESRRMELRLNEFATSADEIQTSYQQLGGGECNITTRNLSFLLNNNIVRLLQVLYLGILAFTILLPSLFYRSATQVFLNFSFCFKEVPQRPTGLDCMSQI